MTQFHVDAEVMMTSTTTLQSTVAQMQSLMATMQGQLSQLSQSWTGAAAVAFQDLVSEWHGTQRMVEGNLEEISVALSMAQEHYAEVESANARMFAH